MTEHVRVAVIGGGIVGCSVLYRLAERGWTDTLLLERRELTSGSTWHAAGNVTYFGHYPGLTRLYVDSIRTYLEAERETGRSVGFHPAGSLRLATTREELDAYRRLAPMYDDLGIEYRVVDPAVMAELHPLLVTAGLFGAAHTPTDGHVDASGATHALAGAARAGGRGSSGAARPGACAGWPVGGRSRPPREPSGRSTWFSRAASGRGNCPAA